MTASPAEPPGATPSQPPAEPPGAKPSQPLGEPLNWRPAARPAAREHRGTHVTLRPLAADRDAAALYAISHPPEGDPSIWTYLYDGPFANAEELRDAMAQRAAEPDTLFFVVAEVRSGRPLGMVAYLAIVPDHGSIELGHIWFSAALKRSAGATEAIYLLCRHAIDDLGYRRLEWKCNALNQPSRAAAQRFGFIYEGTFMQHRVAKGRNRDTAWFALTDGRWPSVRAAFQTWLAAENFDARGVQRTRLSALTAALGGHAT